MQQMQTHFSNIQQQQQHQQQRNVDSQLQQLVLNQNFNSDRTGNS